MDLNIEELVKKQINAELSELDIHSMVSDAVRKIIDDRLGNEIREVVKSESNRIVSAEIKRYMADEIEVKSGYGDRGKYESFEEFFKSELTKKINSQWDVKREIERLVKERVSSLMQKEYGVVIESIVDTLTKSKLVTK